MKRINDKKTYKIAVVGATGLVGRMMIKVLEGFNIRAKFYLFASSRSAGKKLPVNGKDRKVLELNKKNVIRVRPDFALFSAGGAVSREWVPVFASGGCVVVDNSSAFRMEPGVPLIVPEVNGDVISGGLPRRVISNPNCTTIGAVVALKPLDDAFGIRRVVFSTYQAMSGAGVRAVNLYRAQDRLHFNNLIPQIDEFVSNGNTKEEEKMIHETWKILGREDIAVSATCVRVPIENCHSISVNVQFERAVTAEEVRAVLERAPGVIVMDEPHEKKYPMPVVVDNRNEVFVGRIRGDGSAENCVNLFLVLDNIRKGAATNAVQILKLLIK